MMNRTQLSIGLAFLVACAPQRTVVEVPPPPAPVEPVPAISEEAALAQMGVDAVLWQNTSAEAYWLFRQGYEFAEQKLDINLKSTDPRPTAVIVDIDETVLDNSPYQVNAIKRDRTFDQADWKVWTDMAAAQACPGALEFLQHAKAKGCAVFYITNRDLRERASTMKNLNDLGFPFADETHLLLMEGTSDKTERRALVAATHRIVLLVGDQLRDFDERYKERSANYGKDVVAAAADSLSKYFVLLPNPMYGTYKDAVLGKGADAEKHQRTKTWFQKNGY